MNASDLATWAELLEFKTVWVVTTILLGDVVTLFALDAGHSDLWADIRALACHRRAPLNRTYRKLKCKGYFKPMQSSKSRVVGRDLEVNW